jgi:virulence-associated protein VagC
MFKKPFALALLLSSFQPAHGLNPHRILDQDFVNELNDLSERVFNLANNSARMLEDQFKYGKTQLHELTEDANFIRIKIQLPEDFKFDQHKVEVIDHDTIRLTAEDEKYEVTYYSALKNHLFSGQVIIINKTPDQEKKEKRKSEAVFKYSLTSELNFEEVEVEYDKETATLTFSLPKKVVEKHIKTINVKTK